MSFNRIVGKYTFFFLFLIFLFLSGCGKPADVVISEIDSKTVTFEEIKHMNNCGGKADSEQTVERSFTSSIGGGIGIEGGYDNTGVIKGKIDATYDQFHNSKSEITLKAPPGTDMDFVLRWTENERAGNVTVEGKKVIYTVRIPVSVELVSANDKSCGVQSTDHQPFPTRIPAISERDDLLNGQVVTGELLSQVVGGKPELWKQEPGSSYVWTYSNKGNNIKFKHPGGDTIITYWAGFGNPSDSSGCNIVQPTFDNQTKYIKCPIGEHEFIADQIGFHLIDEANYFGQ